MIKIDDEKNIHLTRGDETNEINLLPISFDNYTLKENDTITLIVMKKKGYTQVPILKKEYTVDQDMDTFNLKLTHNDTIKFPVNNKKTTYWYDIVLNKTTTLIGFDEENAKKFIVYPGGVLDE